MSTAGLLRRVRGRVGVVAATLLFVRVADPVAEEAMGRSLRTYGQLAPVTACWRDGRAELLDGFKRHAAAGPLAWPSLSVRLVDVDERSAKAAIFGLNRTGQHPSELEEAWIVQALVREDGLTILVSV
jgi:ParB-like chromosome segregation protein Spo0J